MPKRKIKRITPKSHKSRKVKKTRGGVGRGSKASKWMFVLMFLGIGVGGGVWLSVNKNLFGNKEKPTEQEVKKGIVQVQGALTEAAQVASQEIQQGDIEKYSNDRYGYKVEFPKSWNIFTEGAGEGLIRKQGKNGKELLYGGFNFWSNKSDIEEYTPDDRPADFHLLALTICQTDQHNEEELAREFGFFMEEELRSEEFKTENLVGKKFTKKETGSENFHSMIVLRRENLFYVFNIAFANGNEEMTQVMGKIVESFETEK